MRRACRIDPLPVVAGTNELVRAQRAEPRLESVASGERTVPENALAIWRTAVMGDDQVVAVRQLSPEHGHLALLDPATDELLAAFQPSA